MIATPEHPRTRGAVCGWCILFVTLFTLSGILGTKKQIGRTTQLWTQLELEASDWVVRNVNYDAGFVGLCADRDFVSILTGRQIFCVDQKTADHFGLDDSTSEDVASLWNSTYVGRLPSAVRYCAVRTGSEKLPDAWRSVFANGEVQIYERK
jgi:hypothetical protein